MASLNIPFLVFSRSNFMFESDETWYSGLIHQADSEEEKRYEVKSEEPIMAISDIWGEAIFFNLDVDSRTIVRKGEDGERTSKTYKSYYHLLLHPKLLLIPSISMKERVGRLLDASIVKSPAKFILSTSEYLWVTLHNDNIIRIWSVSDGRWLMLSPKELFLTKLKRIFPIPTYDGYILCFGEEGDVYIINMFRMRLLKHSSIDIDGISHISLVKVDRENIWILITDEIGKISSWRIKTNLRGLNIQTVWSDEDSEIEFQMKVVLDMPIDHSSRYLLVYSDTPNTDLLTISRNEVTLK